MDGATVSYQPCDHHIQAEKLARLKADWNSYGARPISPVAIQAAMDLLNQIVLIPTARGGVQIEVHTDGWDFELEFWPDGQYGFGIFSDPPEARL